jgi:hypothetical protein
MQICPGFLEKALAFLMNHKDVAGVGGHIVEQNTVSLEYIARSERVSPHRSPGFVDRLDGGGLYRRSAIEEAGYLSDRNLHSYEEFDLAIRLRALNWKLWRLPMNAASHVGHDASPYRLLMRRWRTRYVCGLGELIRGAWGRPYLLLAIRDLRELRLYVVVLVWWLVLASVPFWPLAGLVRIFAALGLLLAPVLLMALRKRSLTRALYSMVSWCFNAAGLLRGLLQPSLPARERIQSKLIRDVSCGLGVQ